jgi:hypothetical protein
MAANQQVIVLFSVVNTSKHAILLMSPQIQLGGQDKSGKLIKHEHWSTAEQLAVIDFRLSRISKIHPVGRVHVTRPTSSSACWAPLPGRNP